MISCDCSCDDGEMPRCSDEAIRKARKPHECCECHETIVPGKQYEDATGIDCDGGAYHYRTCLPCKRIREHYCPSGWFGGCLAETIMDCIGFLVSDMIRRGGNYQPLFNQLREEDPSKP